MSLTNNHAGTFIMVAFDSVKAQRLRDVPEVPAGTRWCDNVFDAVATLVELSQAQPPASALLDSNNPHADNNHYIVCVLVDCLGREEMAIFSCLAQINKVQSVAITAVDNLQKLNLAKLNGAHEMIRFVDLPEWIKRKSTLIATDTATEKDATSKLSIATAIQSSVSDAIDFTPEKTYTETGDTHRESAHQSSGLEQPGTTPPPRRPPSKPPAAPTISQEELDALLG